MTTADGPATRFLRAVQVSATARRVAHPRLVAHAVVVKTLLVMRHGKSAWSDPSLPDHDRPLARRGRDATERVAAWLGTEGLVPAQVRCSSAARTRQTLELLRPALGAAHIEIDERLYLASAGQLVEQVRALPDEAPSALLIGHNPGLQELVVHLAGPGPARRRVERKFPTAALAVLALAVGRWADTSAHRGELEAYVVPRELG